MMWRALSAIVIVGAGCATGEVRTPDQAKNIALSSVCVKREPLLAPNEQPPTQ